MGIDLNRFKGGGKSKEWLDWLNDDPAPVALPERLRHHGESTQPQQSSDNKAPATSKRSDEATKTVAINITVPKFKAPNLPYRRLATIGVAVVVIGGVGILATTSIVRVVRKDKPSAQVLSAESQVPTFEYLLPDGKPSSASANTGVFDQRRNTIKYTDKVGGVRVAVSQQPLPNAIKDDADNGVKKIAEDFGSKQAITTASPTAYIGTDVKGPQTVIFHKKGVLVIILSDDKIDEHDWAEYITRLK